MLKNYLKVAIRNILKHKGYSFINITGLAVGMACCLLLLLWVQDELSFDRFHDDINNVYRVICEDHSADVVKDIAVTPAPLAPVLKDEIPEIIYATRVAMPTMAMSYREKIFNETVLMADPDLFQIFSFNMIEGDPATALENPLSLIVTQTMVDKYFGREDPIGKTITIGNKTDFTVTGILEEVPYNSSIRFDFVAPFKYLSESEDIDYWGAYRYSTFVRLQDGSSVKDVNRKISGIIGNHRADNNDRLYLQPYKNIHLYSNLAYDFRNRGSIKYVWIFSFLALLIIIIASINFMNLATARSSKRAREIGMRKVVGAFRSDIIRQFYGESILLSFIALFFAIILVEISIPVFNELTGKHLILKFFGDVHIVLGLIGLTLFTGIVSGSYPALLLASFKPVAVLKGGFGREGKGSSFRKILVITQFSLSIFLIVGSLVVGRQLDYMKNKNLGFDKEHVIYMPLKYSYVRKYNILKNRFLQNPNVTNVTASFQLPSNIGSSPGGMDWEGRPSGFDLRINAGLVDFDYFETFGMKMADGRSFSREYATDSTAAYILNEEAVRQMGISSPVGKWFSFWDTPGTIVGVVKDFHSTSLQNEINPIVLKIDPYWLNYMYAKIKSDNISAVVDSFKKIWNEILPGYPFEYRFLDETIDRQYRTEERLKSIFGYFTFLAIFISCLGLFGLASYMAEQRTKEIGIRKVLGASIPNIITLISREFVLPVFVANAIALPAAYLYMNHWLNDYAYRTNLGWSIFIFAGSLSFIITLLTVSYQAFKAAFTNPVKAIKYE